MAPTRVALADDDVLLREGLASLPERSSFEVVGQVSDGPELLALVREQRPDLAVVDDQAAQLHMLQDRRSPAVSHCS